MGGAALSCSLGQWPARWPWRVLGGGSSGAAPQQEGGGSGAGSHYFLDDEALFETPQYLRNMAAGMMMSPPRLGHNSSDDSPDPSEAGDSLWSYRDP